MDETEAGCEIWMFGTFRGNSSTGAEGEVGADSAADGGYEGEVGNEEDVGEGGSSEEEGDVGKG